MVVYNWESSVIEVARKWPQAGAVYEFFKFWTDYSESKWILMAFVAILAFRIGWKKLIAPTILTTIAVILGDLCSRRILKIYVMRPRPNFVGIECHLSKCWGFVSSHSANITAAAVVLCLYDKRNAFWTIPTVILVSFSRVYLADHFPLDVIGGNLLGLFVGLAVWSGFVIFKKKFQDTKLSRKSLS